MVSSMMYQLLNHPEFSMDDLDSLYSVSAGAGRLHDDLRENPGRREKTASLSLQKESALYIRKSLI